MIGIGFKAFVCIEVWKSRKDFFTSRQKKKKKEVQKVRLPDSNTSQTLDKEGENNKQKLKRGPEAKKKPSEERSFFADFQYSSE